eukprot:GHVQ01039171.1.p1 GENE.GHVQ01039171.1~~GHVQ01039171.1.p1  ORF type:complete len:1497 (+),score=174.64 GHVQ01039171.1:92-4492(+)
MGAAPGNDLYLSLDKFCDGAQRCLESEARVDEKPISKWMRLLDLKDFRPVSEIYVEEYMTEVARTAEQFGVPLKVVQAALKRAATVEVGDVVASVVVTSFEQLVDEIIMLLFPANVSLVEVEQKILMGERKPTVLEARLFLQKTGSMYLRMCKRRECIPSVSGSRLVHVLLSSVPGEVECELRRHHHDVRDVRMLLREAFRIEANLKHFGRSFDSEKSEGYFAYPQVVDDAMDNMDPPPQKKVKEDAIQPADQTKGFPRCRSCGVSDKHWSRDCEYKAHRCGKCEEVGHIAAACLNTVVKDSGGRIVAVFKHTASSIITRINQSKTARERVMTVQEVIAALRERMDKKRTKDIDKRAQKRQDAGKDLRQKKVVMAAESLGSDVDIGSDSDEQSEMELLSEAMLDVGFWACVANKKTDAIFHDCVINGVCVKAMVDSGAEVVMCRPSMAQQLGLSIPDRPGVRFRGVGRAVALRSEGVEVHLKGSSCRLTCPIFVVDIPTDVIVGREVLRQSNAAIDFGLNCITLLAEPEDESAKDQDYNCRDPQEGKSKVNAVSGVNEEQSDNQLLKVRLDELKAVLPEYLNREQRRRVVKVFMKYKRVWLRPKAGGAKVPPVEVRGVNGSPVRMKLRPLPPAMREEVDRQLESMLKAGVIRPSRSPWAAAIVMVPKPGGGWRMAIDYRGLNKMSTHDAYPVALFWEILQELAGREWHSVIDLNWGFWNLLLAMTTCPLTAFLTHRGLFEFLVLPFGLNIAGAEMQRVMDVVTGPLRSMGVRSYVDDTIMSADGFDDHLEQIDVVLGRLHEFGLYIRISKLKLFQKEMHALGHVISREGIRPDPKKVQALVDARAPCDKNEVRSFIACASYLRRFIPGFSQLVAPLTDLTKKSIRWEWGEAQEDAFEGLRDELVGIVGVGFPRGDGPFVILCDASNRGVGAALAQVQDGEVVLLEFASTKFNVTQCNWATREREAYAIVYAVEKFADYLIGHRTIVLTDHQSLVWLNKATSGKLARWSLRLQQFQVEIAYLDGEVNCVADFLSRTIDDDPYWEELLEDIAIPGCCAELEESGGFKGGARGSVFALPGPGTFAREQARSPIEELRWCSKQGDGCFYHVKTGRLYVPPSLREQVLAWVHLSQFGGHAGIAATCRRLRKMVWWPKLSESVIGYIKGCILCTRHKQHPRKSVKGFLTKPGLFQVVSMDVIGPRQWQGTDYYVLIIVDHHSRFMRAAVTDVQPTGDWIVEQFDEQWITIFGAPEACLVDRGSEFCNRTVREYVVKFLQAHWVRSSPGYPEGNAINESSHRVIDNAINLRGVEEPNTAYKELVRYAVLVHNSIPIAAGGLTPIYMLVGQEVILPGWQWSAQAVPAGDRLECLRQDRMLAMTRHLLRTEDSKEGDQVNVGDVVVYELNAMLPRTLQSVFDRDMERSIKVVTPLFPVRAAVRSVEEFPVRFENLDNQTPSCEFDSRHRDRRRRI